MSTAASSTAPTSSPPSRLGARACLVGRAYLYGLMAGGQDGVARALDILRADMRRTLALLGVRHIDELGPESVRLRPF